MCVCEFVRLFTTNLGKAEIEEQSCVCVIRVGAQTDVAERPLQTNKLSLVHTHSLAMQKASTIKLAGSLI